MQSIQFALNQGPMEDHSWLNGLTANLKDIVKHCQTLMSLLYGDVQMD